MRLAEFLADLATFFLTPCAWLPPIPPFSSDLVSVAGLGLWPRLLALVVLLGVVAPGVLRRPPCRALKQCRAYFSFFLYLGQV